ncbi:hypothetical protein [Undibacterium sp.]|uniref:type IV pilus assembly protein FimV n=1 Tax=Undibacterium sp. TaxID=1914977 RepID=UPI002CA21E1B|nr:hypothetical protein [Undibacterium sp.]HTD05854.1 hypothetical protein [Undibacterium sp.]
MGQPLRAGLNLLGVESDIAPSCIRAKLESTEGNLIANAGISVTPTGRSRVITLTTRQSLQEPAVRLVVDVACEAQLHREFMLLLDPPLFAAAPASAELPMAQAGVDTADPAPSLARGGSGKSVSAAAARAPRMGSGDIALKPRAATIPKAPKLSGANKIIKAPKDVLKLSSDDAEAIPQQGLRLSDTLSERPMSADQQNMAELRIAQAELAALLRGEKPEKISGDQLTAGQQKVQSLQAEANQLKRQNQADKAELEALKEGSYSRNWVVALAGLLLVGLTAIAVLAVQLRRQNKKAEFRWGVQNTDGADVERKMSVEEIVNSVQASYNASSISGGLAAAAMPATAPEVGGAAAAENSVPAFLAKNTAPAAKSAPATAPQKMHLPALEDSNSSTFNFFAAKGSSMKVEEISDVTQEAEFWMSVNDPQRAIEILEPQAAIEVPESPVPWLYLLDLYRVTKNKEKYDALRDRFVLIFNANIPDFEVDPADTVSRLLEDFEHLMGKICGLWNTNDILPFLQSLLVDDRDGKRMGFELPVYRDILLLIAIANELERAKAQGSGSGDRWNSEEEVTIPDVASLDRPNEDRNDFNPIDFEVIDFPKSFPISK